MFGLVSQRRYEELEKEHEALKTRIREYEKIGIRNNELETQLRALEHQLVEVKSQIREQTEADLYFTSAKIQDRLLRGDKKEDMPELILQQGGYLQTLSQMQGQSYGNSFLQRLGLAGAQGLGRFI